MSKLCCSNERGDNSERPWCGPIFTVSDEYLGRFNFIFLKKCIKSPFKKNIFINNPSVFKKQKCYLLLP